jgi:hypothetical protein
MAICTHSRLYHLSIVGKLYDLTYYKERKFIYTKLIIWKLNYTYSTYLQKLYVLKFSLRILNISFFSTK